MKALALVVLGLVAAAARPVHAEPVAEIVRARLAPALPAGLGIAHVHLPASLAKLDVAASQVTIEVPGELKLGRPSIKVAIKGKRTVYVPVSVGRLEEVAITTRTVAEGAVLTAEDLAIEARAIEGMTPAPPASLVGATASRAIAQGAPIDRADVVLAPPLARGTEVALEIHRGSVRVRGTGNLEMSARPGGSAVVRVTQTRTVVRGILVAPATVIVGEMP